MMSETTRAQGAANRLLPTPSAPLAATTVGGWDDAYDLKNDSIRVVLSPKAGRLIHFSYIHQPNLLRKDDALAGRIPEAKEGEWLNHGGDWLWPTAQSYWERMTGSNWPPPRLLEGRPWEGRGWAQSDGSFVVELKQSYGAPLNLNVTRKFTLPSTGSTLMIEQRMERTAPSDFPVTLWNITQIHKPEASLMAIDRSKRKKGLRPILFGDPAKESLSFCDSFVVYTPEEDSTRKLASTARPSWIAATVKDTLVLQIMAEPNPEAPHPDEDSTIQMFSMPGEYIEIEPLGEEKLLKVGETLENRIHLVLMKNQQISDPCDWEPVIRPLIKKHASY